MKTKMMRIGYHVSAYIVFVIITILGKIIRNIDAVLLIIIAVIVYELLIMIIGKMELNMKVR